MPLRLGFAIVRGRSMLPTLRDGDRLLVRYDAPAHPDALAVVVLPDGVMAVKRLDHRGPDGWWVSRDNANEGVDSWTLGAPVAGVVAIVIARVWPQPRLRFPAPSG